MLLDLLSFDPFCTKPFSSETVLSSSKKIIPCCACRCFDFVPDVMILRSQSMPASVIVASALMWHPVLAWPAN